MNGLIDSIREVLALREIGAPEFICDECGEEAFYEIAYKDRSDIHRGYVMGFPGNQHICQLCVQDPRMVLLMLQARA